MSEDRLVTQRARAGVFAALHQGPPPLLLTNVWDPWSARVAAASGAAALGTSSFAVAFHHGVQDGELLPFDTVVESAGAVVDAVDIPVSVDLEAGRGAAPAAVAESVGVILRSGAVGLNLEDAVPGQPGTLFSIDEQCGRLAAARGAADALDVPVFLNARCDVWFGAALEESARLDDALRRAERYRAAGADGFFVPGLVDLEVLRTITLATPLAVNVMVQPGLPPLGDLSEAGVRRVSQGATAFLYLTGALSTLTQQYQGGDLVPDLAPLGAGMAVLPNLVGVRHQTAARRRATASVSEALDEDRGS